MLQCVDCGYSTVVAEFLLLPSVDLVVFFTNGTQMVATLLSMGGCKLFMNSVNTAAVSASAKNISEASKVESLRAKSCTAFLIKIFPYKAFATPSDAQLDIVYIGVSALDRGR
jgi:hypothetical protein